MLVYLAVAVFPFIVAVLRFGEKSEKKNNLIRIIVSVLPMFFLIAFRNEQLGADTGVYLNHFRKMCNTPWSEIFENSRMEHGYLVFVKLVTLLTEDPIIFQVIYTSIYMICLVSFSRHLDFSSTWFLFFFATLGTYTFMFTGVRQCLAMSICLFSYKFIKKKKFIPFILCVALAYTFHKSAILFLPAYFIYSRKVSFLNILIYTVITIVVVIYLENIQEFFNEQLDYNYEIEDVGNGWIYLALLAVMTIISFIMLKLNGKFTREAVGLFNIGIISVVLWVLRIFTRVAERPSYYFLFFSFAMFGYTMNAITNNKDKNIVNMVFLFLSLGLFVYRFFTNFASLVPYMFYTV